jgi:DNA-binding NarL/FixJ family response regulator
MTNIQPMPLNASLVISPKMLQFGETNALLQVSHEFIAGTLTLPLNLMPEQLQLLQVMLNQSSAMPTTFGNIGLKLQMTQLQTPPKTPLVKNVKFTNQEKLVLVGLRKGFSYKKIAANHFVSENTVRSQVHGIYQKLGVHSRTEALNKVFGK